MRKPLRCQIDVCIFDQPSDSSRYLRVSEDKNNVFYSAQYVSTKFILQAWRAQLE